MLIFNQHKVTSSKSRFRQGRTEMHQVVIQAKSLSKSSTGSWSLRRLKNVPHPFCVDPQGRLGLLSSSCCRWKRGENRPRSRGAGLRFHRAAGNKREGCNLPRSHLIPWQVSRLPLATGSRFLPRRLAGFTTEPPNLLNSFSGHAGGAARERRRLEASRAQRRFRSENTGVWRFTYLQGWKPDRDRTRASQPSFKDRRGTDLWRRNIRKVQNTLFFLLQHFGGKYYNF